MVGPRRSGADYALLSGTGAGGPDCNPPQSRRRAVSRDAGGPTGFALRFGQPDEGKRFSGASGGTFVPLMNVTQNGLISGQIGQFTVGQSGFDFRFAIDPNGSNVNPGIWSSVAAENSDGLDHMVTWLITGNSGHGDNVIGDYVIAFEDLPLGQSDLDYNDLVI